MAITKYKTKNGEVRYKATPWKGNRSLPSKSFSRKIDAEQWHDREQLKLIDEKVGRLKGTRVTIGEFFIEVYLPNSGVRESTLQDYSRIYRLHIGPKFGCRKLNEVSSSDWSFHFQEKIKSGMSKARVNRVHAVASGIYSLAMKWEYVNTNPLLRVDWEQEDISEKIKFLDDDELIQFLEYAHTHSKEMYPIYHFIYETGLRISEVLALQWDCVSFSQNSIEVRRTHSKILRRVEQTTKTGHRRTLAVNPSVREILLSLFNQKKSEFVFTKENGEMLSYETLRGKMAKDIQQSGVTNIGLHGLRHTFASHFMMRGGNIYDLKSLMGHGSIETTMGYAHLSPNHLASKVSLVQFQPKQASNVVTLKTPNHFPTIAENENKKASDSEHSQTFLSI